MMNREPLFNTAIIISFVGALLTLLTAFGVPLTEAQQAAINQAMIVAAPIIVALVARNYVTPVADPQAKNTQGEIVALVPEDGSELPE